METHLHHNLKVAHSFSKGANLYETKDRLQDRVNDQLFHHILAQEKYLRESTILETGCGTGGLSKKLAPLSGTYILSDISHGMVARASQASPEGLPIVVDAEHPSFIAGLDVIVSSLTLHWLHDPKQGLQQLIGCLKPGGRLYLTTMGSNSFYEWRTAHTLLGFPCGTPDFISMGALKSWLPPQGTRTVFEEWITQPVPNPVSYFKELKSIGAGLPHPAHKPLPARAFREVVDKFSESGRLSYQILYAFYEKPTLAAEEE